MDLVAAAAFDCVAAAATREAVVPVGPDESIVAAGAGQGLHYRFLPGEKRSDHHYHHREEDV